MPSEWAKAWAAFAIFQRYSWGRGDGRRYGQTMESVEKYEKLEIERRAAEHD